MARAQVEHDFMGMEKVNPSSTPVISQPRFDRRHSFRGISRINPEIVKSVLASASNTSGNHNFFPQLPVFRPYPSSGEKKKEKEEEEVETAPMTIFYKGSVSVFDLPKDKADIIMKFANTCSNDANQSSSDGHSDHILDSVNDGDLPIKRKKSLQRFFEKRKERLISVSPYPVNHVSKLEEKSFA